MHPFLYLSSLLPSLADGPSRPVADRGAGLLGPAGSSTGQGRECCQCPHAMPIESKGIKAASPAHKWATVALHAFDPAQPLNIPCHGALTAREWTSCIHRPAGPQYDYHRCLPACVCVVHPILQGCIALHRPHSIDRHPGPAGQPAQASTAYSCRLQQPASVSNGTIQAPATPEYRGAALLHKATGGKCQTVVHALNAPDHLESSMQQELPRHGCMCLICAKPDPPSHLAQLLSSVRYRAGRQRQG